MCIKDIGTPSAWSEGGGGGLGLDLKVLQGHIDRTWWKQLNEVEKLDLTFSAHCLET